MVHEVCRKEPHQSCGFKLKATTIHLESLHVLSKRRKSMFSISHLTLDQVVSQVTISGKSICQLFQWILACTDILQKNRMLTLNYTNRTYFNFKHLSKNLHHVFKSVRCDSIQVHFHCLNIIRYMRRCMSFVNAKRIAKQITHALVENPEVLPAFLNVTLQ